MGLLAAALLATGAAATDKPMFGDVGLDVTAGDPSVKPGDDFYRYANGGWDDRTVIPQDRAWYGENLRLNELVAARPPRLATSVSCRDSNDGCWRV